MKNILILGAGFGGLTLATELEPLAAEKKINVTLIDKNPSFQMGFSMQWALAGRRSFKDGERSYKRFSARHVRYIKDSVTFINTGRQLVECRYSVFKYDILAIALGVEYAPERIPGLKESAYNLCDRDSVFKLKQELERIEKGDVVIMVSAIPFKCPPAPYEYAMLIDDLLRKRGVRSKVQVTISTPEPRPMPVAPLEVGEKIIGLLQERHIEFLPDHVVDSIDYPNNLIRYQYGPEAIYTILAAIYPHKAPKILEASGLTNETGFVPVELDTFKTDFDNIYAIGDATAITLPSGKPHPKAGVMAEAQAKRVSALIKQDITGEPAAPYSGAGTCFIDVGNDLAAPAQVQLLAPEGPQVTLNEPSSQGLKGKKTFEQERLAKWFS